MIKKQKKRRRIFQQFVYQNLNEKNKIKKGLIINRNIQKSEKKGNTRRRKGNEEE